MGITAWVWFTHALQKKPKHPFTNVSAYRSTVTVFRCTGFTEPDKLPFTLATAMSRVVEDQEISPGEGILHHAENVDLVPANIELAGMEVSLINAMSREKVLKQYLEPLKRDYDYILIDCMPSLGMLTINALAAADSVLVPAQPQLSRSFSPQRALNSSCRQ